MTTNLISFHITVNSTSDIDKEDLAELSRELYEELNEVDSIISVEPIRGNELPKGAKGPSIDFATLLIKIAEFGGITALITVLGTWLGRDKSRTLKLQIGDKSLELTGLSAVEQQELTQWFQTQAGLRLES